MLPGKKYNPEEILQILRRRYWLILIPFAVISATTAVVARKLPDRYMSKALVLVVPQRVPEEYVKSTVTTRIEDRLQAIAATILSRTRLEPTIEKFDLYPEERRNGIMEDVVQRMKNDIDVQVKSGDAFTVSYTGYDRFIVQKVAADLTDSFINESFNDREQLAQGTDQFLETTLQEARSELIKKENTLADYRMQHKGELPSQLEANLQALVGVQQQLRGTLDAISHAHERRLGLETNIRDYEAAAPSEDITNIPQPTSDGPGMVSGGTAATQLALAQRQVQGLLLSGKTEIHPDVKLWRKAIKELEEQAQKEAIERPVTLGAASRITPQEQARRANLKAAQDALASLDRQVADLEKSQKDLLALAKSYQTKIDAVPQRENEMTNVSRDYATLQSGYSALVAKKEESRIAANLEHRQKGESFKVIDRAPVPERPTSPNRPMINTVGVFLGMLVGLGLVGLLEYRDSSFKLDEEVTQVLSLPVLAVVPLMRAEPDRRSALRRKVLVSVALGTAVLGCLAVLGYTYVR